MVRARRCSSVLDPFRFGSLRSSPVLVEVCVDLLDEICLGGPGCEEQSGPYLVENSKLVDPSIDPKGSNVVPSWAVHHSP